MNVALFHYPGQHLCAFFGVGLFEGIVVGVIAALDFPVLKGNLVLDTKRVCATPKGLEPLVRDRKVEALEAIVASQHNIAGVQVFSLDEVEATAGNCKEALGVPSKSE